MKYTLWIVVVFANGMVASANLTRLVHTNPHYQASWIKVGICLVFAACAALWAKESLDRR